MAATAAAVSVHARAPGRAASAGRPLLRRLCPRPEVMTSARRFRQRWNPSCRLRCGPSPACRRTSGHAWPCRVGCAARGHEQPMTPHGFESAPSVGVAHDEAVAGLVRSRGVVCPQDILNRPNSARRKSHVSHLIWPPALVADVDVALTLRWEEPGVVTLFRRVTTDRTRRSGGLA